MIPAASLVLAAALSARAQDAGPGQSTGGELTPQPQATPTPPGLAPIPGEQAVPDQLAPSVPAAIPAEPPPTTADIPAVEPGQLEQQDAPGVFEQYHTTMTFGAAPAFPLRGPHASRGQIDKGLEDLQAREAAQKLLIEAQYRDQREAFLSDEGFRALPRAQRRAELRRLSAQRDEQLRALEQAVGRMREVLLRRRKELNR